MLDVRKLSDVTDYFVICTGDNRRQLNAIQRRLHSEFRQPRFGLPRIEGDPLDNAWRAETGGAPLMTIDLAPLREAEALELAGELIEINEQVVRDCIARAEGNPLFLEQLLRNAEESTEEAVPASIQSLVLARMDRLSGPGKAALQAASVIGQRFALDALRHLIETPGYDLRELVEPTWCGRRAALISSPTR